MMIEERFLLAKDRIKEIKSETGLRPEFQEYFVKTAGFLELIMENYAFIMDGGLEKSPVEELKERNYRLYEDILPENYGKSYGNPRVCGELFGKEYGQILCFLYAELRSLIPLIFERRELIT